MQVKYSLSPTSLVQNICRKIFSFDPLLHSKNLPELYPLVDQNPRLWRGKAHSWSCKQCPCSHPYTCLPQVLPSSDLTSWLNQGQGLCLQSKLGPLSKRISAQREVRRQGCLSFWRKYHFHFITFYKWFKIPLVKARKERKFFISNFICSFPS